MERRREKLSVFQGGGIAPACGRQKLLNEHRAGVMFQWTSWGTKGWQLFKGDMQEMFFGVVHAVESSIAQNVNII